MATPTLHKRADRLYTLTSPNVGSFREHLEQLGFIHRDRKDGDLFLHAWVSPDKTSIVILFPSHSISVLGPAVHALDELVECECAEVPR